MDMLIDVSSFVLCFVLTLSAAATKVTHFYKAKNDDVISVLQNMGNFKSKSSKDTAADTCLLATPRLLSTQHNGNIVETQNKTLHDLPTPKHMLWGAESVQDHYEMIEESLQLIQDKKGADGLRSLNLEYRMWHNPKTCHCTRDTHDPFKTIRASNSTIKDPSSIYQAQQSMAESSIGNDDVDTDAIDDFFQGDLDTTDNNERPDDDDDEDDPHESIHYMAPIKGLADTLRMEKEESITDLRGFGSTQTQQQDSERSAATMFSLATHHTLGSTLDDTLDHPCQLRLWHTQLNVPLTEQNHVHFLAHGPMYDHVARLCMEAAQDIMQQEGKLEWRDIHQPNHDLDKVQQRPRMLLGKRPLPPTLSDDNSNKTLIIITGKGLVRAGIFSRRHLITTGVHAATAMTFVQQATQRNMAVAILDPNAHGPQSAMQIVRDSLNDIMGAADDREEFYVLAHSMAGSQLARYLLQQQQQSSSGFSFLHRVRGIAFTDSNHNIQWTKNHDDITALLEGPASVYFKSHKLHDHGNEPRRLGELDQDGCQFWRHRFGAIKTVWAGTHEHALTNYTAREYIWDHFDSIMEGNDENDPS
jgi:hypothetical protein